MSIAIRIQRNSKKVGSCWIWTGCKKRFGYGTMTIGSRKDGTRATIMTHRASYMVFKGEIPKGMCVLHKCDNPSCVNPDHLWLGTRQDNVDDRERKGRNNPPRGEAHPKSPFTWNDIYRIRKIRQEGKTLRGIAREYGVHHTSIMAICSFESWKLPEPPKN